MKSYLKMLLRIIHIIFLGLIFIVNGQELLMKNVGTFWFKAILRKNGHCLGVDVTLNPAPIQLTDCKDDLKYASDQIWRFTIEGYLISYWNKSLAIGFGEDSTDLYLLPPSKILHLNYNGSFAKLEFEDGDCIDFSLDLLTKDIGAKAKRGNCENLVEEDHSFSINSIGPCNAKVGVCDDLIIMDNQLSASSVNGLNYGPEFGRLNHPGPKSDKEGWCASYTESLDLAESAESAETSEPWLQVDYGEEIAVSGIIIQGSSTGNHVELFAVEFSYDGVIFNNLVDAPQEPNRKVMTALNSANTEDDQVTILWPPFTARVLKVVVIQYSGSYPCMRMEVLGCSLDVRGINAAYRHPANQSSDSSSQTPSASIRAVDGARGAQTDCPNIQTNNDVDWWIVELDQQIYVHEIIIINGPDHLECKTTKLGKEYLGFKNTTKNDLTCQRWDSQSPHNHTRHIRNSENYCRNPDDEPEGPWCYTTNPDKRWRYCGIEFCSDIETSAFVSVFHELKDNNLVPNFESSTTCNPSPQVVSVAGDTTFTCDEPILGKYVVIHTPMKSNKLLLLCEIEVYSDNSLFRPGTYRSSCLKKDESTTTKLTTLGATTNGPTTTRELTTEKPPTTELTTLGAIITTDDPITTREPSTEEPMTKETAKEQTTEIPKSKPTTFRTTIRGQEEVTETTTDSSVQDPPTTDGAGSPGSTSVGPGKEGAQIDNATTQLDHFKIELDNWLTWTECTKKCGGGIQIRLRLSLNNSGNDLGYLRTNMNNCTAFYSIERQLCNPQPCPSDGEWYKWSDWSDCSSTCGTGTKRRTRRCIGPFHGGKPCKGSDFETMLCNNEPCQVTEELTSRAKLKALNKEPEFLESDSRLSAITTGSICVILVLTLCGAVVIVPDLLSLVNYLHSKSGNSHVNKSKRIRRSKAKK